MRKPVCSRETAFEIKVPVKLKYAGALGANKDSLLSVPREASYCVVPEKTGHIPEIEELLGELPHPVHIRSHPEDLLGAAA